MNLLRLKIIQITFCWNNSTGQVKYEIIPLHFEKHSMNNCLTTSTTWTWPNSFEDGSVLNGFVAMHNHHDWHKPPQSPRYYYWPSEFRDCLIYVNLNPFFLSALNCCLKYEDDYFCIVFRLTLELSALSAVQTVRKSANLWIFVESQWTKKYCQMSEIRFDNKNIVT